MNNNHLSIYYSDAEENMTSNLKQRIDEEMTVDYGDALERNFELAKLYIGITPKGKLDIKVKNALGNDDIVALYLIGKQYAKVAERTETNEVLNKELMDELQMPLGSVVGSLKRLRDSGKVTQVKEGVHRIKSNSIEPILTSIKNKVSNG